MTIRGLDDEVRDRLRVRAAEHGRSMEAEARAILTEAVSPVETSFVDVLIRLGQVLREEGLTLELPDRTELVRDPFA